MNITLLDPRKALNKAFLKIKPNRSFIENFKINLTQILDAINEKETEEFHKNLVIDFLKKTYYDPNYFVNTKGRNDLVIHNGKEAKTNVGVIIEVKSPVNKSEMISVANLNCKALQELVLYYMRERITHKNTELKHVVVTNIYEWFVFDAQLFNKLFAENKTFVKQFIDFEEGRLSGKTTDYFYKEIAKTFIEGIQNTIEFAYFDIRNYDKPLRNEDKEDDKLLVALFKLLSPEHLLKLSFTNDSNSLDKNFYSELLHIIGLTEVKEGGKKLIERHKQGKRNSGSLLENAIDQLDGLDKISRLQNAKQYGDTHEERLFNVALELTITWVNRILFLKLLEAQLISYHKGDKSYAFLNANLIKDYDNLNSLFFQVLARKPNERNDRVQTDFAKVPYLNSSLFEPTDLEHNTLFVSQLEDNVTLPLLPATVIKDTQAKKQTGTLNPLDYFLSFLDAYDFASEGSEDIQEDNKTLINASVLGLIFEKINGYKDGSFFTPSFITMYMCKETIRRAVVQKFNETKNWNCTDFDSLYDKIEDRKEANTIINSIKICDPAVGSGHFLVSALNEIIAIKNDLKVLQDHEGKRLKEYHFEVVNDELMVTDEDSIPFQYNPNNKESQRVQETLFHEKQTIIENCLFGVDINPNSVKICRLRLWIELLKNAYYRPNTNELETLPNIDINIKSGNSLISRFGLDTDLKEALKKSKLSINAYKNAVNTYRNADSKEQKREMERLINDIKGNFISEIGENSKDLKDLLKYKNEYYLKYEKEKLFEIELNKAEQLAKKELTEKINKSETAIEEIKNNKIYENAFEWRFEFPEVLDENGDFIGFDAIIGNPPYLSYYGRFKVDMCKSEEIYFKKNYSFIKNPIIDSKVIKGRFHSIMFFLERSLKLSKKNGITTQIIDLNIHKKPFYDIRKYIFKNSSIIEVINDLVGFDNVFSGQSILMIQNKIEIDNIIAFKSGDIFSEQRNFLKSQLNYNLTPPLSFENNIIQKIYLNKSGLLGEYFPQNLIRTGITFTGMKDEFLKISNEQNKRALLEGKKSITSQYCKPIISTYINYDKDLLKELNDKYANELDQSKNKKQLWIGLGDSLVFEKSKIIILQTGNQITATYSEENLCLNLSLFSISNENEKGQKSDVNLKLILSQLNSKLITYFALTENFIQRSSGAVPQIRLKQLKELPIIIPDKETANFLIDKVDQILSLKSQDPQADTSVLEQEIDVMVYALYGLTEEEIKVVEES